MDNRRYFNKNGQSKLASMQYLVLTVLLAFALGTFISSKANAAGWDDWPEQSRAQKKGTFTYIYGGFGFAEHDGTAEGANVYRGFTGRENAQGQAEQAPGALDDDDYTLSGGFGVRFGEDFSAEFGLTVLNGPYDSPNGAGDVKARPDEPVFELSLLKGFKVNHGPPLLRYTARIGFATIDDPHTDDNVFWGLGVAHEPFRLEYRFYDFDVFETEVLAITYIYDF